MTIAVYSGCKATKQTNINMVINLGSTSVCKDITWYDVFAYFSMKNVML